MKTAELIKQAEELLGKIYADDMNGVAEALLLRGETYRFARNHMQELIDKLNRYEEVINDLLGWQSMAPAHVLESARKALGDE